MSAYLARLKQLESVKNSHYVPDSEPTKPSKAPFVGFDGTGTGHIVKKIIDAGIVAPPESSETAKLLSLQDRQREARTEWRRQKVIAMLEAAPDTQRAIYVDDASDPLNIIVAVAVRHPTGATCEMLVSKARYDVWQVIDIIERHGQTTH